MFVLLPKTNIDFQGKRHFWMTFSGLVLLAGLISIVLHGGLNLSIDFAGGVAITLRSTAPAGQPQPGEEGVRNILERLGVEGAEVKASRSTQGEDLLIHFKEEERIKTPETLIRASLDSLYADRWRVVPDNQLDPIILEDFRDVSFVAIQTNLSEEDLKKAMSSVALDNPRMIEHKTGTGQPIWILSGKGTDSVSKLREVLAEEYPGYQFEVRSIDMVGPRIGSELRTKGLLALLASWVLIILYLWWRFDLVFGVAAVIALIHNVLIALTVMSILNFEISMTVLGAFLTIIGYSVNDTIVVFDRIRENLKKYRDKGIKEVINLSINDTLGRTIVTGGSVIVVVVVLLVNGGEVLRGFALAMLVGIVAGTYSSIYIASPILIDYVERTGKQLHTKMKGK